MMDGVCAIRMCIDREWLFGNAVGFLHELLNVFQVDARFGIDQRIMSY
jgi:hypothetical protein